MPARRRQSPAGVPGIAGDGLCKPSPPAAPCSAVYLAPLTPALCFQAGVHALHAVGGDMRDFQQQVACIAPALASSIDAFQREAGSECK